MVFLSVTLKLDEYVLLTFHYINTGQHSKLEKYYLDFFPL